MQSLAWIAADRRLAMGADGGDVGRLQPSRRQQLMDHACVGPGQPVANQGRAVKLVSPAGVERKQLSAQLWLDLVGLNRMIPGDGSEPPLATVLRTAAMLIPARIEATQLTQFAETVVTLAAARVAAKLVTVGATQPARANERGR